MAAETEPARIVSLVNAAIGATLGVLALVLNWSGELVGGLTLAFSAWVAVAGEIIRSKVTPNVNVALTQVERIALEKAGL